MLRSGSEVLKIKPKNLSSSAITRFKAYVILGAPGFPIFTATQIWDLSAFVEWLFISLAILSIVFLLIVSWNPVLNTLTRTSKNLDEWELHRKTAAESFALRCWLVLLGVFWLVASFWDWTAGTNTLLALRVDHLFWGMCNIIAGTVIFISAHIAWTLKPLPSDG